MDRFWAAPPVTRTLVAAALVQSVLVYGRIVSSRWVLFAPSLIFKLCIPEVWRLATSFLLTGPGIYLVIDLYFLWTYSIGLELGSARFSRPGDYFVYVVFCAVIILFIAGFLLGGVVFLSPLLLSFIYTFAQDNRGTKAHFIILQIPVELLPWAMLTLTLVMGGPAAAIEQGSGLLAAHLYDFLTRLYPTFQGGRNYIVTPAFITRAFGGNASSTVRKPYGVAIRPAAAGAGATQPQSSSSRTWTGNFSNSWGGRGKGIRLGGD